MWGEVTQHGISMEGCAATAYRFLVVCFQRSVVPLCYSYNNYMADSSVRARLVARRLGESALYADRVAHKLRARGSATKVERDDFCNMEMFSKIWGLQSKVGQVYLFLSNKGADSQRKREAAQRVPNPTRPPVRQSMRRVFRLLLFLSYLGHSSLVLSALIFIFVPIIILSGALSRVSCYCIVVLSYSFLLHLVIYYRTFISDVLCILRVVPYFCTTVSRTDSLI